MRQRQKIGFFEIGQAVVVFLLAAFSVLRFGGTAAAPILGVICLLFSQRVMRLPIAISTATTKNGTTTCMPHGVALFPDGQFSLSPDNAAGVVPERGCDRGHAARRAASRLTLEFHGLLFLAAAAYASGLLGYARERCRDVPSCAGMDRLDRCRLGGCVLRGRRPLPHGSLNQRLLQTLSAILAVAAVIIFLVSALVWLAAIGMTLGASHVAVIRTLITAWSRSRWRSAVPVGSGQN